MLTTFEHAGHPLPVAMYSSRWLSLLQFIPKARVVAYLEQLLLHSPPPSSLLSVQVLLLRQRIHNLFIPEAVGMSSFSISWTMQTSLDSG